MLLIQNCVSILECTLIQISFDNITAISPLFHFYHRFMPLANFGKTRIKITTDILEEHFSLPRMEILN